MVITNVNQVVYLGDGVTTAFPFTFTITDASEVYLQLVHEDDTVTTITKDFYVDVTNNTVHYPGYAPGSEPPEANRPPKVQTGEKLVIYRDVPMTQEINLGDKWPFTQIEFGLDKLTMIAQQIYSYTNRKLDAALASMFQLAGIITDSDKLQHITDQLNAIDDNAEAAEEYAELAKDWATKTNGTVDGEEYSAKKYAGDSAASATSAATSATNAENLYNALIAQGGHPFQASTVAAMTDTTKIYVYTGSETGYTFGDWYFWNGTAWTDGGVYNAIAFYTDSTLTISGAAADAKATGESFTRLSDGGIPILNEFAIGTISSAGNVSIDSSKANVISKTALYFTRPVRVQIGSGYRFVIHYYSSSTMNSTTWEADKYDTAWKTTYVDIPANQYFNIVINKSGVTTPNVDTYKAQMSIATAFQEQINQNTEDIADLQETATVVSDLEAKMNALQTDYIKTLSYVIGSTITNPWSVDTTNTKRIATASIITPTKSGVTITCDTGYQLYLALYNDDNTWRSNSGWVTSITIQDDRKFAFTIRKSSSEVVISSVDELLKHIHSNVYVGIIPTMQDEIQNNSGLPSYAEAEYNTVLEELYDKYTDGGMIVIGFNTDQHVTYGTMSAELVLYGLKALNKMTRMIPFNVVCLGGDAAGYNYEDGGVDSTQEGIIKDVTLVESPLFDAWCPVVSITGNHDAYQNAAGQTDALTYSQIFNTYIKRQVISKQVVNRDLLSTDCYIDDDTCNIRFIFVDDTQNTSADYTDRVRNWLTESLSSTPAGYNIIIMSHRPQNSNLGADFSGKLANQDIINPYASRIICCINGHAHKDGAEYLDGILYIETTCAMAGQNSTDGYTRTIGTADETAFDVFMIDTTTKHIYAVRYGAGSSREFIYEGTGAGEVS